jgi:hypothetical protein
VLDLVAAVLLWALVREPAQPEPRPTIPPADKAPA